jgi:hypothetical protein
MDSGNTIPFFIVFSTMSRSLSSMSRALGGHELDRRRGEARRAWRRRPAGADREHHAVVPPPRRPVSALSRWGSVTFAVQ